MPNFDILTPASSSVTPEAASVSDVVDQLLANVQTTAENGPVCDYSIDGESYNRGKEANDQVQRLKDMMQLRADLEGPIEIIGGAI